MEEKPSITVIHRSKSVEFIPGHHTGNSIGAFLQRSFRLKHPPPFLYTADGEISLQTEEEIKLVPEKIYSLDSVVFYTYARSNSPLRKLRVSARSLDAYKTAVMERYQIPSDYRRYCYLCEGGEGGEGASTGKITSEEVFGRYLKKSSTFRFRVELPDEVPPAVLSQTRKLLELVFAELLAFDGDRGMFSSLEGMLESAKDSVSTISSYSTCSFGEILQKCIFARESMKWEYLSAIWLRLERSAFASDGSGKDHIFPDEPVVKAAQDFPVEAAVDVLGLFGPVEGLIPPSHFLPLSFGAAVNFAAELHNWLRKQIDTSVAVQAYRIVTYPSESSEEFQGHSVQQVYKTLLARSSKAAAAAPPSGASKKKPEKKAYFPSLSNGLSTSNIEKALDSWRPFSPTSPDSESPASTSMATTATDRTGKSREKAYSQERAGAGRGATVRGRGGAAAAPPPAPTALPRMGAPPSLPHPKKRYGKPEPTPAPAGYATPLYSSVDPIYSSAPRPGPPPHLPPPPTSFVEESYGTSYHPIDTPLPSYPPTYPVSHSQSGPLPHYVTPSYEQPYPSSHPSSVAYVYYPPQYFWPPDSVPLSGAPLGSEIMYSQLPDSAPADLTHGGEVETEGLLKGEEQEDQQDQQEAEVELQSHPVARSYHRYT